MSDQKFNVKRRWLSRRVLFYLISDQGADAIEISCVFDCLPGVAESILQGLTALGFASRDEEYFYTATVTAEEALLYFLPVPEDEEEEEEEITMDDIEIVYAEEPTKGAYEPSKEELKEAMRFALERNAISISMLQRRFNIGYGRAGKIVDALEKLGCISGFDGAKARNVLITSEQLDEIIGD